MTLIQLFGRVYATVWTIVVAWTTIRIVYDAYRERWNEKFRLADELETSELHRSQYARSDFRAFVQSLYDDTIPRFDYGGMVIVTIGISLLISITWMSLYVFVVMVL
jgi:hypothetical protein